MKKLLLFGALVFGFNSFGQEGPEAECKTGDCLNGSGILVYSDKTRYEGLFKGGVPNGQGKITYSTGDSYDGMFKDGVPEGDGIMKINGLVIDGVFRNGELSEGTISFPDGRKQTGKFIEGKLNGHGIEESSDYTYTGYWSDGLASGKGKIEYQNGSVFEGLFKDGKRNGEGIQTFVNKGTLKGTWIDDEYISGQDESDSPNTIFLNESSGVLHVNCAVNGQELPMVFDTGASMSSLESVYLKTMYNTGKFTDQDVRGVESFMDANGDINENAIINIKEFRVGNAMLYDIEVAVAEFGAPNLLGLNTLKKLGNKLEIDLDKNLLRYYK